jgi:hypothetical protein
MAIMLECINFIVPIALIRKKYPGGWEGCLSDHREGIGGKVWYDEHLFRDGAMNAWDMQQILDFWVKRGFKATGRPRSGKIWKECCVIESFSKSPTLPCDWLEVSPDAPVAWLKGTEPGAVAGGYDWEPPRSGTFAEIPPEISEFIEVTEEEDLWRQEITLPDVPPEARAFPPHREDEILEEISRILFAHDPMRIACPGCDDEYSSEALTLLRVIRHDDSEDQVLDLLKKIMILFFDEERVARLPQEPMHLSASAIWKLAQDPKTSNR